MARITAENSDGAGILFHVDSHFAYGITAKHVVFQHGKTIQGLKAELRSWQGRQFPVEVLKLHYQEDLAVFRADLGSLGLSQAKMLEGIPLDQLGASNKLDPGDPLYSLGHSPDNAWIAPKQPVRFSKRAVDNANAFLFENACPRGHSGGAVFDGKWQLVGMMIDAEPPFCRALRIEPILKIVQGWKLENSLREPPTLKVDEPASRQTNVAVIGFDNRSTKNLPNLGNVAQDITTSYLHTLPGVVLVSRDRLDSVRKEIKLPDSAQTGTGITNVGHLLQADALVTGSIVRYDVERRSWKGFGTSALQDVFRMALTLQILDVKTGRVQFSKNFEVERTKQYPKADSAPSQPIDLTSELLEALLDQAKPDLRSALTQVVEGLGKAGQFIDVPVRSTPAGADIILNGIYMGKTPKTLQLGQDVHEIQIMLEGYQPWNRRFRAKPGEDIAATLVPKGH
ncbi:MAG TPA: trypsin-like peptidase domain-containing protein [Thermoanaerobaculia bacterium]|nr:trypsin-like peptidase domain-containing protein [Thermoanaerobaculia bacterium]